MGRSSYQHKRSYIAGVFVLAFLPAVICIVVGVVMISNEDSPSYAISYSTPSDIALAVYQENETTVIDSLSRRQFTHAKERGFYQADEVKITNIVSDCSLEINAPVVIAPECLH